MKISEIIAKVEAYHGPLEEGRRTCDIVQYGDPDKECTGIVTTCCPTAAVIQQAAELGYNFVLGHEPLFFDGWDETDWQQDNQTYLAKKKLLDDTGIVVYRDHDHMHHQTPDGIFTGLTKMLGWEQYLVTDGFMPGCIYELPPTTVGAVADHPGFGGAYGRDRASTVCGLWAIPTWRSPEWAWCSISWERTWTEAICNSLRKATCR